MNKRSFMAVAMPRVQDAKDRIEKAALEMFVSPGVDAASIKEIARRAGVSQGAMYNHYKSKDELAYSLFLRGWSEIGEAMRLAAADNQGLENKFRAMIAYVFDRFDKDWAFVSYTFTSRHHFLKEVSVTGPRLSNPYNVFRAVIRDAMRRGEIAKLDLEIATSLVIGAVIQVIDTKIVGRIRGNLRPHTNDIARSCFNLLSPT